jgi:hypothetical protein
VWRCHHRSRAALNAEGSLGGVGGRFNVGSASDLKPPFRAFYSSVESAAALLEVVRHLGYRSTDARAVVALQEIAMRTLTQLDVVLQRVFDWSRDASLTDALRSDSSYRQTQDLAAAAVIAGAEGILVSSATGIDSNLVIFVENLGDESRIDIVRQITDLRPVIASLEALKP